MIIGEDGTLWLIDFGILGRLAPREQRFHAEILYGFLMRDYLRIAEVHFEAGYVPAHHTVEDFASALRSVGEPIFGPVETSCLCRHWRCISARRRLGRNAALGQSFG